MEENTKEESINVNVEIDYASCPQSLPATQSFPMSQPFA